MTSTPNFLFYASGELDEIALKLTTELPNWFGSARCWNVGGEECIEGRKWYMAVPTRWRRLFHSWRKLTMHPHIRWLTDRNLLSPTVSKPPHLVSGDYGLRTRRGNPAGGGGV